MANYEVLDREVVDRWGDKDGRAEVQAVHETENDLYEVRVCYYQDNGRFGQSAATLSPDPDTATKVADAVQRMAERAREAKQRARLADLEELIESVGYERAKELLEKESK